MTRHIIDHRKRQSDGLRMMRFAQIDRNGRTKPQTIALQRRAVRNDPAKLTAAFLRINRSS